MVEIKIKGRFPFFTWKDPWDITLFDGRKIDIKPFVEGFFKSIEGKRTNEKNSDLFSYSISVDDHSKYVLKEGENQTYFLKNTDKESTRNLTSYIYFHMREVFYFLIGRMVIVEICDGQYFKIKLDTTEKVYEFSLEDNKSINELVIPPKDTEKICGYKKDKVCIFFLKTDKNFYCRKYETYCFSELRSSFHEEKNFIGNCGIKNF